MRYPTEDEARELLSVYHVPYGVIEHSREVSKNSISIGNQIIDAGNPVDLELLGVGGLLHDIGRWRYCREHGYSSDQDYHEYETGRILRELGYVEFGNMLQCHLLGGLTSEETAILGYPESVDLMPKTLDIKIICIADKIRSKIGIYTLDQKIEDYRSNRRLHERYFTKLPGLLEITIERVTSIWHELEKLGMKRLA